MNTIKKEKTKMAPRAQPTFGGGEINKNKVTKGGG